MIKYKGLRVITSRGVYEPAEDTFLTAEVLELQLGMTMKKSISVLDMGTGTGLLGLIAAEDEKTREVLFADINLKAVELCTQNIAANKALLRAKCKAISSDLFSDVEGTFDIIIFNAPYLRDEKGEDKNDDLVKAWAGGPEGIEVSVKFLEEAKDHMNVNGKIILVASSLSNIKGLDFHTKRLGFEKISEKKRRIFYEDIMILVLGLA